MKPVMYIFVNRGLGMSEGKMAAQAAHAAVEAYRISKPALVDEWYVGGHHTKLVMEAEDHVNLCTIQRYIEERGFRTKLIIDEGRTEIRPFSATALGVEIVDKDETHTAATFSSFKIYKPKTAPSKKKSWLRVMANFHGKWDGMSYHPNHGGQSADSVGQHPRGPRGIGATRGHRGRSGDSTRRDSSRGRGFRGIRLVGSRTGPSID